MTNNLVKRLEQHNLGKTKSSKPYKPFEIVYNESYENKAECRQRELFIKNNHAAKQAIIDGLNIAASSSNG